jgi:hypothetical protein
MWGVWGEEMLYQQPPRIERGDYRPSSRKKLLKELENEPGVAGGASSMLAPRAADNSRDAQSSSSSSSSRPPPGPSILGGGTDSAMDLAVYGLVRCGCTS